MSHSAQRPNAHPMARAFMGVRAEQVRAKTLLSRGLRPRVPMRKLNNAGTVYEADVFDRETGADAGKRWLVLVTEDCTERWQVRKEEP